ncbi:MAG: hypothetical protein QM490_05235 [Candidatus Gracilibacteria bacterium]
MNSKKSIILVLISVLLFSVLGLEVHASSSFSDLETQIHSGSNTTKIKKLQLALTEFKLYSGEIDGIYLSVESSLLDYQKSTGLIKTDTDYGAGYFGVKTLTSLKEDFPNDFVEITEKHLQMDFPSTNTRYFYITAYYSPLPGQNRYTTGSYSGDIRLNGGGKTTASGKGVFDGLLAAPSNYAYGTKIEFEGLGVGVVEDRGGAIVNAGERNHEYDRIDIWMGYGDEGLARALKWGKRKILGKVVPGTRELSIEFGSSPVAKYSNLKVDAENPKEKNVKELQILLTEIEVYSGVIDGKFDSVKEKLIKYQVDNNIITSKSSHEAGYFGEKTYAIIRKGYGDLEVFKVKNNKLDEDVVLAKDIRDKLDQLNLKITASINEKYGINTTKSIKYRKDIRAAIDKQTAIIKSDLRKKQLKYLKSLI